MISIHTDAELEALFRRLGTGTDELRRFRNAFYKHHLPLAEVLSELPDGIRRTVLDAVQTRFLTPCETLHSHSDEASKLLFATFDGCLIETVLMSTPAGRTSLCVSSQAGCPVDCRFCATARTPFRRNLTASEILDQFCQAHGLCHGTERHIGNVVFMGMGEPFLNMDHVFPALRILQDRRCFAMSGRRILVSTCGIPAGVRRFADECPEVCLAVSLHSADDSIRTQLMPFASRVPLNELHVVLAEAGLRLKHDVMIEYMLLKGINDRDEDAARLVEFLDGLPAYVNLITYNAVGDPAAVPYVSSGDDRFRYFSRVLQERGYKVTRRYSHGRDINAACGQLAGRTLRGELPDTAGELREDAGHPRLSCQSG